MKKLKTEKNHGNEKRGEEEEQVEESEEASGRIEMLILWWHGSQKVQFIKMPQ